MQHLTNFSRFTFLLENSSGKEKENSVNSSYEKRFSCIPKKVLPFVVSVAKDVEGFKQKLGVDLPNLILLTNNMILSNGKYKFFISIINLATNIKPLDF